jgi:hypothetical protein
MFNRGFIAMVSSNISQDSKDIFPRLKGLIQIFGYPKILPFMG